MNTLAKKNICHPLQWVKPELDTTIKFIHNSLKTYTETMNDNNALKEIGKNLHLLRGSLEILEFYGVALLVESMQGAVNALSNDKIAKKEDIFESLLQATLSLEAYIDKLHQDQNDLPLSLLPVMNDIRASIDEPLLSESALFLPNLSIVPKTPGDIPDDYNETCLTDSALSLRPYYQAALLTWFRDPSDQLSMQQMKLVARNLESSSLTPRNRQIWWILGGLYEALSEKGLKANISLKLLLAQADRILKSLSQNNDELYEKSPPVDLLKNALYYISQATSNGERIKTLKHVYNLNNVIPSESDLSTYRKDLNTPNSDALQAIAKELKKSLDQVRATIDNFARNTPEDTERLSQTIIPLKHISDTLSLLSMGNEKKILQTLINKLTHIVDISSPPGKESMLEVASAMLHVESALKNIGTLKRKKEINQTESQLTDDLISGDNMTSMKKGRLPEAEYRLLVIRTAEEAKNNIIEVKNNVLAHLSSDEKQKESMKHIPDLLSEIRGSMIILNNKYLPEILKALSQYVNNDFLVNFKPTKDEEYDAFAEALVSIEYYLEAIAEERNPSTPILEITRDNLKKLGYPVEPPKQQSKSMPSLEAVVTHISEAPARFKPSTATSIDENNEAPQSKESKIESNILTFSTDEADPEVREIFIDEAFEELAKLDTNIKSLKLNPGDADTLSAMRRIYHTLKGSGKIAGANDISDISSAADEYLARVLCKSINIEQQGVALLSDALPLLYHAVECFQERTPDRENALSFQARVSNLINEQALLAKEETSKSTPKPPKRFDDEEIEIANTNPTNAMDSDPEIDSEKNKDEFLQLATIENFIKMQANNDSITPISEELNAAISQLRISADNSGDKEFIQTIELLSKYIQNISRKKAPINQETLDILSEFCTTTKEILCDTPEVLGKDVDVNQSEEIFSDNATNSASDIDTVAEKENNDQLESEILATLTSGETSLPAEELTYNSIEADSLVDEIAAHTIETPDDSISDAVNSEPDFDDDIDLIDIFMEEALELIETGHKLISNAETIDDAFLSSFQRLLHTMKGSARMAGVTTVGNMAHSLESVFEAVISKKVTQPDSIRNLTQETLDAISDMIEDIQSGSDLRTFNDLLSRLEAASNPSANTDEEIDRLTENEDAIISENDDQEIINAADDQSVESSDQSDLNETEEEITSLTTAPPTDSSVEPSTESSTELSVAPSDTQPTTTKLEESIEPAFETAPTIDTIATKVRTSSDPIKVESSTLDQLVDFATEESAISNRIADHVTASKSSLFELDKAISRTLMQMRDLQFESNNSRFTQKNMSTDNLNLSSFSESQKVAQRLMESIGDIENLHSSLMRLTLETDSLVHQQKKIHNQLHENLLCTRMVTFSIQTQRMQRILRQTCSELNKKAKLKLDGTDGSIDKSMLDMIMGPLEHIIRNAIAHGIESPKERTKKNKSKTGSVSISFSKDKSEHLIIVSDDGAGLNLERIRKKALEKGLINDDEEYSDERIANLIFESGLSTNNKISQISGRGVGMDVVLNTIHELGGSVSINTEKDKGSTFTIRLPFTLSRNHTLIIKSGDNSYAIPSSYIENTFPVSSDELKALYESDSPEYNFHSHHYPLWYIDTLLNDTPTYLPPESGNANIILIKFGQKRIALHVDNIAETKDVVLKPNSPQLSNVAGIAGATVMGDGKVILIIDIPTLTKVAEASENTKREFLLAEDAAKDNKTITTMVVDDSITVRKVTERFLSRNGINTLLAKDGIEALEVLEREMPDVMLLDIEMPGMDGLELAKAIKTTDRFRHIPIIMITSRTGKQHRNAAGEIGVDVFLGKPYQESELLGYIQALTGKRISH